MDIVSLFVIIVVVCVVLWLVTTYIPMPQPIKTVIVAVIALIFCVWLLQAAGLTHLRG